MEFSEITFGVGTHPAPSEASKRTENLERRCRQRAQEILCVTPEKLAQIDATHQISMTSTPWHDELRIVARPQVSSRSRKETEKKFQ